MLQCNCFLENFIEGKDLSLAQITNLFDCTRLIYFLFNTTDQSLNKNANRQIDLSRGRLLSRQMISHLWPFRFDTVNYLIRVELIEHHSMGSPNYSTCRVTYSSL